MTERKGVALMLAVWMVAVLGASAAVIVSAARGSDTLAMNLKAEAQARRAAESGVVMGVAAVDQLLESAHDSVARRSLLNSLEKGRARAEEEELGDERFAYTYVDVNSRLDINWATEQQLAKLFAYFTSTADAAAAAAAIHSKDVTDEMRSHSASGESRREPFRSLEALRRLPGLPPELLSQAAPFLTVDGDGRINAASASDAVLAAAAGDVEYEPSRIMLISRGWANGSKLTHEIQAVYGIEMNKLVLVHWRERDL